MIKIIVTAFFALLMYSEVHAFDRIKNGLETLTSNYLMPLTGAVAGASFLFFVILSFFKQDEYQRKVFQVFLLSVLACVGMSMIERIFQIFN